MKALIQKLKNKTDLSAAEMEKAMLAIMSGKADKDEIATFLLALREKGAKVDEIAAAAKVMRRFAVKINTYHDVVLDTCGTGGDKRGSFNISTIAAFVICGAKVVVAKHGNRSISSKCGSADLLEALGVNLNADPELLSECLDEVGIAFLFAQKLHPAMKNVAAVRKELGVETIFNVLGPLTNPAGATHQMMGVYRRELVRPMAEALKSLGLKRALVLHGSDGLDEVTTTGVTFVAEFDGKQITDYEIDPKELKLPIVKFEDIKGGELKDNVKIAKDVLGGKKDPHRDIVVLNAACGLYVAGKARTIAEGLALAAQSIDSGLAMDKLEALKDYSNTGK